jgi:CheY-like chemotaxis protein
MTETSNHMPKILVVDDDRFFLRQMVDILVDGGFKAQGVISGEQAMELMEDRKFQVIVTDVVDGGPQIPGDRHRCRDEGHVRDRTAAEGAHARQADACYLCQRGAIFR